MPKPKKPSTRPLRVSMLDVAREADVSESTAYNCMKPEPPTKYTEATVTRVRKAAEKLGYRKAGGVTQSQVAQELGVSHTTISLAFDPRGRISDAMRAKVLRKAAEMGYEYQGHQRREQPAHRQKVKA